ncbi:TIM23 complex component [Mortierella alpina]|nr:TIM23 complex component [Mortierella alpina]
MTAGASTIAFHLSSCSTALTSAARNTVPRNITSSVLHHRALSRWSLNRTVFSSCSRRWKSEAATAAPGAGTPHPRPTTASPGLSPSSTVKASTTATSARSPATEAGATAAATATASSRVKPSNNGSEIGFDNNNNYMDWNSYFLLRRTRRNYERVFMVPCALLGLGSAGYYFANKDFDPTPIFGMDQVLVYGLGTIAAGIVGLAIGPVVGNMVFRTAHSKARPLVDRMDKEFHKHIVKNRADPTANSVRNPVPDYYGEKIKSVSEYRKWLRKQREYRRKATFFVGVD